MKKTFTSFFIAFSYIICAQPVIQYANYIGVGNTGTVLIGSKPSSPGSSGTNVTWNFSSLTFTPAGSVSVVSPTSTPYSSSFPGCNWSAVISGTAIGTMYTYENIQSGFIDQLGDNITATGGSTYTPNPKRKLQFPFSYGNSYSDTYQCVSCSPGSFTVTYDGYGTLIINGKTYNNVARIASLFGYNYYSFYNTNPVYPIFSYDTSPTSGPTSTLFEVNTGVGIQENYMVSNMLVYPNPASNLITLQNNNFMQVAFQIFDLFGKNMNEKEHLVQGETKKLDISKYPSGMYLIKYSDEFGNTSFTKLIVD